MLVLSTTMRRSPLVLAFVLIACTDPPNTDPPPSDSPPTAAPVEDPGAQLQTPAAGAISQAPFGDAVWGFVEASSASGRIVVLRWFPGEQAPSFGHHGESSVAPKLTAFDLLGGEQRELDELVDVSASRRHLLALDEGQLWLIDGDTGTWEPLPDVDLEPDRNRCLWPRQAGFSVHGGRVGWVSADASGLHVRELDSGDAWTVAAQGKLWRGWPDEQGRGAVLIEIPAGSSDWPEQRTSCACRWCNRFAMSYGNYGWSGPSFELVAVAEDGKRSEGEPPAFEHELHGPTSSGCELRASEQAGEALEHGPWRWECAG